MIRFFSKNFLIKFNLILVILLFTELIFGFWFSEYNLGPYMREHRLKSNPVVLTYGDETYNFVYKRNYYGFRGEEIDPSEIEAVIVGGTIVAERDKPEEFTITGNLNSLLKERGYNFKIINAGIEGQTTFGHIYNFENWFPKLKGFSPKLYIFYIGLNEVSFDKNYSISDNLGADGHVKNPENLEVFFDNLKSKSFFYDKLRKLKHKYYLTKKVEKFDHNLLNKNSIIDNEYINYQKALEIHNVKKLNFKYQKKISNYLNRIEILNNYAKKKKAIPIFINQVGPEGLKSEKLFIFNYSLIEYCNKNTMYCIDLAKKLNGETKYWVHGSTLLGSKVIAETVIDDLINIIKKENLF